jgi:hypothetical protein
MATPVATRVANHRHCLAVMRLSLHLYLHVRLGCRGVGAVLRAMAGHLPPGVPAATTVLNWCCRLGLGVLQRPVPRHDDWIFVIDHTVALGALKCLVVLGIPASRFPETGYSPCHSDMTVLAVEVMANSTGVRVAAVLKQVSARTGMPVQIVCDHGSDLRKGIALFRQQARRCVETYDISHAVATQLQAHWREHAPWHTFLQQAGTTLPRFQQTDLAFQNRLTFAELAHARQEREADVRVAVLDDGEIAQPVADVAGGLGAGEIVQDRLVVLVHQHDDRRAMSLVGLLDQFGEAAGDIIGVAACETERARVPRQRGADAPFQLGAALHHARPEAELHLREPPRPIPARVRLQPRKQRLAAREELRQRIQKQRLAEAPWPGQKVVLARVDEPEREARLAM